MPYGNCGWSMNGGWGMWLFAVLLLIGLVLLIVVAVRLLFRGTSGLGPAARTSAPLVEGGARGILAERYARGEIDSEEYLKRRRTLEGTD